MGLCFACTFLVLKVGEGKKMHYEKFRYGFGCLKNF